MPLPKTELERDGVLLVVQVIGRHVYFEEGGQEHNEGHFDEADAQEAAEAMLGERRAAGWRETEASRRKAEEKEAKDRALAAQLEKYQALANSETPAAAFVEHFAPLAAASGAAAAALARIAAHVERIVEPSAYGFDVLLRGGGAIRWAAPASLEKGGALPPEAAALFGHFTYCWLYRDARELASNNHTLHVGAGSGPPMGDQELRGTELEGASVCWFMEENPWDRYWLLSGGHVRSLQLDGGLSSDLDERPLAEVVFVRIASHLEKHAAE